MAIERVIAGLERSRACCPRGEEDGRLPRGRSRRLRMFLEHADPLLKVSIIPVVLEPSATPNTCLRNATSSRPNNSSTACA